MIPNCILLIEDESDRDFMAQVYVEYQRLMYSTIYKIVEESWMTEDILQTSLVKLIDKIDLLKKLDHNRLANYIITTCKNAAYNELNALARKKNGVSFEEHEQRIDEDTSEIERELILKEDLLTLSEVWGQLDVRSQYLLEARYVLGKTTKEIGIDLEIKPESVRMALVRARKKAYKLMIKK